MNRFITNVVDKPQVFFAADTKIVSQALAMAKHFYDTGKWVAIDHDDPALIDVLNVAKQHEPMEFSPFPELLTEGFETEQIWEEIASQNEPFLHYAKSTVKEYSRKRKRSDIEYEQDDDDASVSGQSMELEHDDQEEEEEEYDDQQEEYDEMLDNDDNEDVQRFVEMDEEEEDDDEEEDDEDIEQEEPR